LVYVLEADCSRGEFTVMWKTWMAASGTSRYLGWLYYPVLLFLLAAYKRPHCRWCFISVIKEPAQPPPGWFLGLTSGLPQFWTITFSRQSIPRPPPNENIPDTTSHVQAAYFSKLFGGNFCEQQLVLGKLLNTVKWFTFCVSFIRMLTIPGWL